MSQDLIKYHLGNTTKMKMPAKLKAKWLKALRSGEYGQTKNALCDGKGNFCCLGVLEHVAMNGAVEYIDDEYKDYLDFPSKEFWQYTGITGAVGRKVGKKWGFAQGLADLNDNGISFTKLADIIEKQVKEY